MEKIEVFFKMLENAEKKNRDVFNYSYKKQICIYANGNEGNGIVGKIEHRETEKTVKYGFLNLKSKTEVSESISGYVVDTKTAKSYYFYLKDDSENFKFWYDKLCEAHTILNKKETEKKDKEYQKFLKREL